jgi:hypothetical protein
MQMPENYRAKAEECLREAEHAAGSERLQFIMMAQRWFELAEFFAPPRPDDGDRGGKLSVQRSTRS